MPFAVKFVEDGTGIIFEGSGLLTEEELIEVRQLLQATPAAMGRLSFGIVDLESVVELRLDHSGVRRLAGMDEILAGLAANMAVVVVAPSDHMFGIARMWEAHADGTGWPIMVVRSRSEAHVWLAETLASRRESSTPSQSADRSV